MDGNRRRDAHRPPSFGRNRRLRLLLATAMAGVLAGAPASALELEWSYNGPIAGLTCVQVNEPSYDLRDWDDNYPSGGNFWSEYVDVNDYQGSHQNETGPDHVWDHPYEIDPDNIDHYPLIPEFPTLLMAPLFMAATILMTLGYKKKRLT